VSRKRITIGMRRKIDQIAASALDRRMRIESRRAAATNAVVSCAFALVATWGTRAHAAPCDDPRDAWVVIDASIEAGRRGDATAVERAAAPLTRTSCTPSGEHADLIARARLEARLAVLEAHAGVVRAALARMPAQTARGSEAYLRWLQRSIAPWLTAQMNSIRTLTTEAGSVAHDAAALEPSIAADAIAALLAVEGGLVAAIESVPAPDEFRRNPDLLSTYRSMVQTHADTIASEMRAGYDRITAIGRRTVLLSRDARRVEAMLIARGALTTADRNTATRGGGGSNATSAASAPASSAPSDADTVHAGVPRTGGDNGLSNDAIRSTVQGAMASFETCHEHALDRDRTIAGDVAIRFVVDTSGHATQLQITRGEGPLRSVAQCIGEAIHGLTFTAPRAPVTVDYPFR
jgi:hypothetical protein